MDKDLQHYHYWVVFAAVMAIGAGWMVWLLVKPFPIRLWVWWKLGEQEILDLHDVFGEFDGNRALLRFFGEVVWQLQTIAMDLKRQHHPKFSIVSRAIACKKAIEEASRYKNTPGSDTDEIIRQFQMIKRELDQIDRDMSS